MPASFQVLADYNCNILRKFWQNRQKMQIELDRFDLQLLDHLQQEGRISNAELAERLALSPSACLRRLRALEQQGLIEGYHARLNAAALGLGLEAFVSVTLNMSQGEDPRERFHQLVEQWPEVISAAIVTGETQYLLHVVVRDIRHFSDFVMEKLYREARALDIRSSMVLTHLKRNAKLPLALRTPNGKT